MEWKIEVAIERVKRRGSMDRVFFLEHWSRSALLQAVDYGLKKHSSDRRPKRKSNISRPISVNTVTQGLEWCPGDASLPK